MINIAVMKHTILACMAAAVALTGGLQACPEIDDARVEAEKIMDSFKNSWTNMGRMDDCSNMKILINHVAAHAKSCPTCKKEAGFIWQSNFDKSVEKWQKDKLAMVDSIRAKIEVGAASEEDLIRTFGFLLGSFLAL